MKKRLLILLLIGFLGTIYSQERVNDNFVILNVDILNTKNSDFGVSYYKNDQILFATPNKKRKMIQYKWKPNNQPYLDLYMSEKDITESLTTPKLFSSVINSKYHEGTMSFSSDYQTVYFTRDNYEHGKLGKVDAQGIIGLKLYKATNTDGVWNNIEELPFNSNKYSVGHPALSADGKKLYFISDMPGSMGKTDVFVVDVLGDNNYSRPKNLGPTINTAGKEMFPFIDENNILYFSSDGKPEGLGGLDVYYSRLKGTTFSATKNLGAPINSDLDDFSFVKKKNEDKGFFASNRYGGKGDDDIYAFIGKLPSALCTSSVAGTAIETRSKQPISNATINVYNTSNKIIKETTSDIYGKFSFNSDCNTMYKIEALKGNYRKTSEIITTGIGELQLELPLEKVMILSNILTESDVNYDNGKLMIDIEDIYFNYKKYYIRDSEKYKLERLIELMNDYPLIKVEIGSHTDSRGGSKYNSKLSNQRANATLKYVISRGISSNRIFGTGYGENQPRNGCVDGIPCTKEEYQQNRRTEFVIIE